MSRATAVQVVLLAATIAFGQIGPTSSPSFAQTSVSQQNCGPDFVTFVGRRWLLSSNAADKKALYDPANVWTVQKRSILSVRAFKRGEELRAFVALDLGKHRLSRDGNPIDVVITAKEHDLLVTCLSRKR